MSHPRIHDPGNLLKERIDPIADEPPVTTLNAAWMAFQERLGNLTTREENMSERAFRAGWQAALTDPQR